MCEYFLWKANPLFSIPTSFETALRSLGIVECVSFIHFKSPSLKMHECAFLLLLLQLDPSFTEQKCLVGISAIEQC